MTNEVLARRFSSVCPAVRLVDKLTGIWFVLVV
jgi:hypothetical protein